MQATTLDTVTLHFRNHTGEGVPVVFLNSLGTDFRIWDDVIACLDPAVPYLCMDKRGHGLSDEVPITMDRLADDVARLMDGHGIVAAVVCGVSVGGMIAQALAFSRPDLVAGLVLCCTGTKIGDAESWNARIEAVSRDGLAAMAPGILERWFSETFRRTRTAELAIYRNMLIRTSPEGYAAVCAAIRDADFTGRTCALRVPTICIAGAEDLATPPDLVGRLADSIPGAVFRNIPECGHLPGIEAPRIVADALADIRARLA